MSDAATLIEAGRAEDLAHAIEAAWEEEMLADRGGSRGAPRDYMYASGYSECTRAMVYSMTSPQDLPPFPVEVLARMERGSDRERDLLLRLARVGQRCKPRFDVVAQQERFQLRDHKDRVVIVGKVDARLKFSREVSYPIEVKAWSPFLVDRVECFDDLFENPWTRKGAYQICCYLYGSSQPVGFLLLDRAGMPKLLPAELERNWDRVDEFLLRAEKAVDYVKSGEEAPYIENAGVCKRCDWFGSHCNPPLLAGQGMSIVTDPEIEAMLERREELKESGEEFTHVDKAIKERLRGLETGIAGRFLLEGKFSRASKVVLPKELKKQYTVVDERGKFTLTITPVAEKP